MAAMFLIFVSVQPVTADMFGKSYASENYVVDGKVMSSKEVPGFSSVSHVGSPVALPNGDLPPGIPHHIQSYDPLAQTQEVFLFVHIVILFFSLLAVVL